MANDYYVYLLVEVREGGDEDVFYVGKGRGVRGGARLVDYVRSTIAGKNAQVELRLAGAGYAAPFPAAESDDVPRMRDEERKHEEHAKVTRIREAHQAGNKVRVDLLRTDLSEDAAFLVESAVIDVIGLARLSNVVHGHSHGRVPALAALEVLDAHPVQITDPGFQVVVTGVWGGGNSLSGLVAADPDDI